MIRPRTTPTIAIGLTIAALAAPGAAVAQTAGSDASPIPGPVAGAAPAYVGAPASLDPFAASTIPRHPFMAPNGRSNLHDDAFQSDTYRIAGPLGASPAVSSTFFGRECASVAFDSRGRIVTICVGLDRPVLAMIDPVSLKTLAAMQLPPRQPSAGNPFTDFSGGGYFYLDNRDRAVFPTTTAHVRIVGEAAGPAFSEVADFDLTPAVGSSGKVISALPDWKGRIWFVATSGVVGWIDPGTGELHSTDLGEKISNSFAVGQGSGVFVVTDSALYRLEAKGSAPSVIWRHGYANTGAQKPGQTSPGSGTTPTLLRGRFIAITDNADPLDVVVMDRSREPKGPRVICRIGVLGEGTGSTDQSLIGIDRSIVVENNFGYTGPAATENGGVTLPGLERVELKPGARRGRDPDRNCRPVWRSEERAPSVVPKLSLGAGLVYTYTKPVTEDDSDAWYLTALDFDTGETRYSVLTGFGLGFNNHYAPVTIGPDGTAYVGALGGLIRVADSG